MRFRPAASGRALGLLAGLLAFDASAVAAGPILERTMAFVNKKPVLLSDVELTMALLKLDETPAIERSIDEKLMFEEASRLVNQPPTEEVIASAIQTLRAKVGERFAAAALRRKALVQLAISTYIELRLRPQVRVDDEAVRRVYNEKVLNESQAPAFNSVAEAIREALVGRSLDLRIEEWVASLRRREDVRRVAAPPTSPR